MQSVKYLLDTHTLLWTIGDTKELSKTVIQIVKDPKNEILVSAVSLWEISIKCSIGRLEVDFDIEKIPEYCKKMDFDLISLEPVDALNSFKLSQKENHKDPFDRMLIYQCIKNDFILVSIDSRNKFYKEDGLQFIW